MTIYEVKLRLKKADADDFKTSVNGEFVLKTQVVYYLQSADLSFYGPFVTYKGMDPFELKEHLDADRIYVAL